MLGTRLLGKTRLFPVLSLFVIIGLLVSFSGSYANEGGDVKIVEKNGGWDLPRMVAICPAQEQREVKVEGKNLLEKRLKKECLDKLIMTEEEFFFQNGILRVHSSKFKIVFASVVEVRGKGVMVKVGIAPISEDGEKGAIFGAVYYFFYVAGKDPNNFTLRYQGVESPPLPCWARNESP